MMKNMVVCFRKISIYKVQFFLWLNETVISYLDKILSFEKSFEVSNSFKTSQKRKLAQENPQKQDWKKPETKFNLF